MTKWNDFWMYTRKLQLFCSIPYHKLSLGNQVDMIGSLVELSDGTTQQQHPEQGKPQLHRNGHPNKLKNKQKTKCTKQSPAILHKYLIETYHAKHHQWSFSALPSVSHFTLRLTKRLARILITAHLGVKGSSIRSGEGVGSLQGMSHESKALVIGINMMMRMILMSIVMIQRGLARLVPTMVNMMLMKLLLILTYFDDHCML